MFYGLDICSPTQNDLDMALFKMRKAREAAAAQNGGVPSTPHAKRFTL